MKMKKTVKAAHSLVDAVERFEAAYVELQDEDISIDKAFQTLWNASYKIYYALDEFRCPYKKEATDESDR